MNTLSASTRNRINDSQLAHSTQDEALGVYLQAARDSNGLAICSKIVGCTVFVYHDILRGTRAENYRLRDTGRKYCDGKDVW